MHYFLHITQTLLKYNTITCSVHHFSLKCIRQHQNINLVPSRPDSASNYNSQNAPWPTTLLPWTRTDFPHLVTLTRWLSSWLLINLWPISVTFTTTVWNSFIAIMVFDHISGFLLCSCSVLFTLFAVCLTTACLPSLILIHVLNLFWN